MDRRKAVGGWDGTEEKQGEKREGEDKGKTGRGGRKSEWKKNMEGVWRVTRQRVGDRKERTRKRKMRHSVERALDGSIKGI